MTEHLRYEVITCPDCKSKQVGEVCNTIIWNSYVHECTNCEYIIMESEWDADTFKAEFKVWYPAQYISGGVGGRGTLDGETLQISETIYIGKFRVKHKHQLKQMLKRLTFDYSKCMIEKVEPFL